MFADNRTMTELHQNGSSAGRHQSSHESVALGLLFASKSFFQILVAPFVGVMTDKYD
jgi:hypothetical protein